jgi:Zn-dependent peptidase ImmA (M78 family)
MVIKLKIPFHSYETIRNRANEFLTKFNPTGAIPVPIEEIVEFSLRLNIIPVPGIQDSLEAAGFISSDLESITVDQFVMEKRIARYRFTLAHEIGHLWLHREVFEQIKFETVDEWKKFLIDMDVNDYRWLEFQAHAFAGLVLVPKEPLAARRAICEQKIEKEGLSPGSEAAQFTICRILGNEFNVSAEVIERRLSKDKEK